MKGIATAEDILQDESSIAIIEERGSGVTSEAISLVIENEKGMENGSKLLKNIRALAKEVKETFDPLAENAHKLHKGILAKKNNHLDPLKDAEDVVKDKIDVYMTEQERIAEEEEAKRVAEAQKKRDAELKRAEKRIATLMERAGDDTAKIAALEADLEREDITDDEARIARSQIDVLQGKVDAATAAAELKAAKAAEPVHVPVSTPAPAKTKGVSTRFKTVVQVVSPAALIKAVDAGTIPLTVIKFDETAIAKLVGAGMTVPGVSSKQERIISGRG